MGAEDRSRNSSVMNSTDCRLLTPDTRLYFIRFSEPHAFTSTRNALLPKAEEPPVHPPSITGLYWSIRGEVACDEHTPTVDDPRRTIEAGPCGVSCGQTQRWRYQCQFCAIDGRAIIKNGQVRSQCGEPARTGVRS